MSSRIPERFLFQAQTALLPNDGVLPTACILTECFGENFLPNGVFFTKLGPQVSLFPVPIFGVNNLYPSLLSKGNLVFWVPPYIPIEGMDGSQLLEP
jgi:hypothetical protein